MKTPNGHGAQPQLLDEQYHFLATGRFSRVTHPGSACGGGEGRLLDDAACFCFCLVLLPQTSFWVIHKTVTNLHGVAVGTPISFGSGIHHRSGSHAVTVTDRGSIRLSGEHFAFVGGNTICSGAVRYCYPQNLICTCDPYLLAYNYLLKFLHLKVRPYPADVSDMSRPGLAQALVSAVWEKRL